MDDKLQTKVNDMIELIDAKKAEFKDVKGMEPLIEFMDESLVNIWLRANADELDESWLDAIKLDIERIERNCKYDAGLMSPEDAAARKKLLDFFNSPCDLPPEVK